MTGAKERTKQMPMKMAKTMCTESIMRVLSLSSGKSAKAKERAAVVVLNLF